MTHENAANGGVVASGQKQRALTYVQEAVDEINRRREARGWRGEARGWRDDHVVVREHEVNGYLVIEVATSQSSPQHWQLLLCDDGLACERATTIALNLRDGWYSWLWPDEADVLAAAVDLVRRVYNRA